MKTQENMFSTYKKATGKSVLFLLSLAGAALLTACQKDEPMRDTTYLWGRNYWKVSISDR